MDSTPRARTLRTLAAAVAVAVVAGAMLRARPSTAQTCNRQCDAPQRDANGCCPGAPAPAPAPAPPPRALTPAAEPGCPADMGAVPGGSFYIGGTVPATVTPYCLDINLVTMGAYDQCAASGACPPASRVEHGLSWARDANCNTGLPGRASHPANCVTFDGAVRYCAHAGKHLQSEAEWEWAARGGPRGFTCPWGTAAPDDSRVCWKGGLRGGITCAVGSYPAGAGAFGQMDLVGNVWEWTARGNGRGGGLWETKFEDLVVTRGANSAPAAPGYDVYDLGFRCAKSR